MGIFGRMFGRSRKKPEAAALDPEPVAVYVPPIWIEAFCQGRLVHGVTTHERYRIGSHPKNELVIPGADLPVESHDLFTLQPDGWELCVIDRLEGLLCLADGATTDVRDIRKRATTLPVYVALDGVPSGNLKFADYSFFFVTCPNVIQHLARSRSAP